MEAAGGDGDDLGGGVGVDEPAGGQDVVDNSIAPPGDPCDPAFRWFDQPSEVPEPSQLAYVLVDLAAQGAAMGRGAGGPVAGGEAGRASSVHGPRLLRWGLRLQAGGLRRSRVDGGALNEDAV